jgi:hypothetical protein
MHNTNVIGGKSMSFLCSLLEIFVSLRETKFNLLVALTFWQLDCFSREVEGTEVILGINTPVMSCLFKADIGFLEIFPNRPKDIQLSLVIIKHIWCMVENVANSVKCSWIFLHSWFFKVLESILNILFSAQAKQIHQATIVI